MHVKANIPKGKYAMHPDDYKKQFDLQETIDDLRSQYPTKNLDVRHGHFRRANYGMQPTHLLVTEADYDNIMRVVQFAGFYPGQPLKYRGAEVVLCPYIKDSIFLTDRVK